MHIKLSSLLTEALDHLFHATDINKLKKILDSDALKFTYADGSDIESKYNKEFPFYLSTSRERYGGYARRGGKIGSEVVLILNGKALERVRGIKMIDVDYWGAHKPDNRENNETEERVLSQNQAVNGLKKFVSEIHIYLEPRRWNADVSNDPKFAYRYINHQVIPTLEAAETSGLYTYIYIGGTKDNIDQAFRQQRKSYAISPRQAIEFLQKYEKSSDVIQHFVDHAEGDDLEPYKAYKSSYEERDLKNLETMTDIIIHPEKYAIIEYSTETKELHNLLSYFVSYRSDLVAHFGSTIHNMRDKHPEIFQTIARGIRKAGFTNLKSALLTTSDILIALKQMVSTWNSQRDDHETKVRYIRNSHTLEPFGGIAIGKEIVKLLDHKYRDKNIDDAALQEIAKLLKQRHTK